MKTKIKIKVKSLGPKNQDSFWYDGFVGSVSYETSDKKNRREFQKNKIADIYAIGEIRIFNKNGELVHDGWSEQNSGFPEFKQGLKTDNDLEKLSELGYVWESNNWFEISLRNYPDYGSVIAPYFI